MVPSKPRPIAGQVGEESVLKIGYAHPGGDAGNAVIAFATVLCAAVATVLSDSVSNAALDHLMALDSFCKFPVVFREPPVMTLDAAWDMMEEGFDQSEVVRRPDDLEFRRVLLLMQQQDAP